MIDENDVLILSIENQCIDLYETFIQNIFQEIDFHKIKGSIPIWMVDCGISAESSISKKLFENALKNNENKLTHKVLYNYDCDSLVCSLQNRYSMIKNSYLFLDSKLSLVDLETPTENYATIYYTSETTDVFIHINNIFITLYSCFDVITKIIIELQKIEQLDFSIYPKMSSKNITFGNKGRIMNFDKTGTIYENSSVINTVETIRNELIHNGSWENVPKLYQGVLNNKSGNWVLFPDINETGHFEKSNNRNKFFSTDTTVNETLPYIINESLNRILKTLIQVNKSFYKVHVNSHFDFHIFKDTIKQWYNAYNKTNNNGTRNTMDK
jgi:hypothetical protein